MVVLLPLRDMVTRSRLIAIGKVTAVHETSEVHKVPTAGLEKVSDLRWWKITFALESVLKGQPNLKTVDVFYLPQLTVEPQFKDGERCLLFIDDNLDRRMVVQGYSGKVTLDDGRAKGIMISEQESEQDAAAFVEKVKKLLP
jgi:hypothetical protein